MRLQLGLETAARIKIHGNVFHNLRARARISRVSGRWMVRFWRLDPQVAMQKISQPRGWSPPNYSWGPKLSLSRGLVAAFRMPPRKETHKKLTTSSLTIVLHPLTRETINKFVCVRNIATHSSVIYMCQRSKKYCKYLSIYILQILISRNKNRSEK